MNLNVTKYWIKTFENRGFPFFCQRNLVFATNSNFLISISFQPNGVNLWYFKLRLIDLIESVSFLGSTTLGCKEKRKFGFSAKT